MQFETATCDWHVVSFLAAMAQSGMSIGHRSLIFAVKTIAGSILKALTKPALFRRVRDEFVQVTKGKVHECAIAPDVKPLELARSGSQAS